MGSLMLNCFSYMSFWAGERLVLEKALPRYRRPDRPISASAVPFGPGIDIWRSCGFIGAQMKSLRTPPGGIGRFCSLYDRCQSLQDFLYTSGDKNTEPMTAGIKEHVEIQNVLLRRCRHRKVTAGDHADKGKHREKPDFRVESPLSRRK